jgi:hypothetical protein
MAGEDSPPKKMMPEPRPRLSAELLSRLLEFATPIAAVVGVLGAVAYVVLSVACVWVYAPMGVSPGEVGLDYSALLGRTGTLLAAYALVGLFGFIVHLLVGMVHFRFRATVWQLAVISWRDGRRQMTSLIGGAMIAVCVGLVAGAVNDASRMKTGMTTISYFGVTPPWRAVVAHVSWARKPAEGAPSLPSCLLYLGQSEGTSVFYDAVAPHGRSLRLPTSMLLLEIFPQAHSAVARDGNADACKANVGTSSTIRPRLVISAELGNDISRSDPPGQLRRGLPGSPTMGSDGFQSSSLRWRGSLR